MNNTPTPFNFLEGIDSSTIGFGGTYYYYYYYYYYYFLSFLNRKAIRQYLNFSTILIIIIPVYLLSLGTGIGIAEVFGISDLLSANHFWDYCTLSLLFFITFALDTIGTTPTKRYFSGSLDRK